MNNQKTVNIYIFTVFFILLLFPTFLLPRQADNNDVAEIMSLKLKQKLILSDEQTAEVKVILTKYIEDLTNGDISTARLKKAGDDISSILNVKQKAKYNIIEKDFFDELNQRAQKKILK